MDSAHKSFSGSIAHNQKLPGRSLYRGFKSPGARFEFRHSNTRVFAFTTLLYQGYPNPRPWTGTSPVRNQAALQEVSSRWDSEASSVFTTAPYCSHYCLSSASCQISSGIINVTCLNHPETIPASLSPPSPQKNHLPWNCSFPFSSGIYNLVSHHPLKARGIPGLKARALSQEGLTWALHLNSCATLSLNFPEPDSLSVKYERNNIYQNSLIRAQERQTW